jgi:hypothetical protein
MSLRAAIFGALIGLISAGCAEAQDPHRPAVGGIGSPVNAMIFYVAHGADGACGEGCSEWIAAESTVQWDTHKRLIAILDRQAGRKLPVIIHAWGDSNLNVAASLGRILRDHGIDTSAGTTDVEACHEKKRDGMFRAQASGRAPRCQGDPDGHAVRSRLRADASRRCAPYPPRRHQDGPERHVDPKPAGAQCLGRTASGPDRPVRRSVPPLPQGHGCRARTTRHRRPKSRNQAPDRNAAIRMASFAHRHVSGDVTRVKADAFPKQDAA